jgi:hypothetical protein
VGGAFCVLSALNSEGPRPWDIGLAVVLFLLAASTAAIDEKVAGTDSSRRAGSGADDRPVSVARSDLTAFASVDEIHSGRLPRNLCLARFYDQGSAPTGKWWTPCESAGRLRTVGDVRRALAVKVKWGNYDGEVQYTIPKDTPVTYLRGIAAAQCAPAATQCPYPGGGVQYLFPGTLEPRGTLKTQCAHPNAKQTAALKARNAAQYGPCP